MPPTIRSELDVLLDKVQDEALRTALQSQIDRLRQRRSFGLVFEHHIPERVRLPQHPIRVGSQVVSRDADDSPTWEVVALDGSEATLVPIRDVGGAYLPAGDQAAQIQTPVEALVVISDFGEPVLPGLRFLGSVERGGDKPYHVVINGENHHALEMLRFTHAGKVDCIYIDPPYNSGARDWKYDNDYVDDNDAYRHSKWLAFMERRLKLAKELLKPEKSVVIVTIDEHELQRLRMLLDQTFPDAYIQVVTIVVNPKGVAQGRFARVEEYAIYCFFGTAGVIPTDDDYLSDSATLRNTRFWKGLLRAGTNARPSDGLGMAYPIHVDVERSRVASVGRTLRQRIDAGEVVGNPDEWLPPADEASPHGTVAVWPLRADGSLGVWQAVPETLLGLVAEGLVRCALRPEGWALSYVPSGIRAKIETGEIAVTGRDESGSVLLVRMRDLTRAKTVWKRARHDAGWHGSVVLRDLLGQRMFDFPKSLYAVRDALAPVIGDNRDAVVLDFFAGSGTTAHAVALLNRSDGGRRSSILVTNNEVGLTEAEALRGDGNRPGDADWEARGIFESVTRPRLTAAWTGLRLDGSAVALEYEDGSPAADGLPENVAFLELRYLDPDDVELGLSFDDLAPLLWLRAGAQGPVAGRRANDGSPLPFVWTDSYGVLFDEDRWRRFVDARPASARTAFVVTHSPTTFAGIAAELPTGISVVRIPDSYLLMFLPDWGRG